MERDYNPHFSDNSDFTYSPIGLKLRTSVSTTYNIKDLYKTPELADERAYNIGCSGYRRALINSRGEYKYAPCSNPEEYNDIMKELIPNNIKREYYSFDPTANLKDVRNGINDKVREGFDYKENLLEKTLSNVIFRDPTKESILKEFQRVIFALIESVKQIKNFFNYTVPPNNKRVF